MIWLTALAVSVLCHLLSTISVLLRYLLLNLLIVLPVSPTLVMGIAPNIVCHTPIISEKVHERWDGLE